MKKPFLFPVPEWEEPKESYDLSLHYNKKEDEEDYEEMLKYLTSVDEYLTKI